MCVDNGRCTALEQDRQNLTAQLSDAGTALSDNSAARSKLQQQLSHAQAEREETVRLNLNLQVGFLPGFCQG